MLFFFFKQKTAYEVRISDWSSDVCSYDISHDLRNILATARLVSDRLGASGDPEVKRTTPVLLAAIDRAVELCSRTLDFTREGPPRLARSRFALGELVAEVGAAMPLTLNGAEESGGAHA